MSSSENDTTIMGLNATIYIFYILISICLLIFMILYTIKVLKKCNNNPSWLSPTLITLLVFWILLGTWIPGLGLLFFIILLALLIGYDQKCN
jgi:signal transduction histidine kinase